jgi:hypothetical protein
MNHELHVPRTLTCTCVHWWLCYETRLSISVVENLWTHGEERAEAELAHRILLSA